MFSRSVFRAAAPLRRVGIRKYASQGSSSGGGLGAAGYGAIAAAAATGFGGYYYFANVKGKAPPVPVPSQNPLGGTGAEKSSTAPSEQAKTFQGEEQGFISLKLDRVEDINHNTKKFVFALHDENHVSGVTVASALITQLQRENEKPVIRPYTPTSDEDHKGQIEFIIKKYDQGPMSEHVHSLKPGDTLEIKGPIPKYAMEPNKHEHIGMIAGGTGITPMWQVIRYIFKNPEDKTKVTLVFGNVTKEDILLKEKFDELENTYPQRFRAYYVLDNPPEDWEQGKGFITKDLLQTVLPEAKEENIKLMVCGPPGLYKAVSGEKVSPKDQGELDGFLKELGYSKDQVFKF